MGIFHLSQNNYASIVASVSFFHHIRKQIVCDGVTHCESRLRRD